MMRWRDLVFAALLSLPATASAAPRVVVDLREAASDLDAPLRAELGSLGFEVVSAPEGELEAVVEAQEASLALVIAPREGGYEIWLRDRVTDETLVREVVAATESSAVLATVELVRASLLEVRARHAVTGEVASDEALDRPAADSRADPPPPSPRQEPPAAKQAAPAPAPSPEPTELDRIGADLMSVDLTVSGTLEVGAVWMYEPAAGSAIGVEVGGGFFGARNGEARFFARYHSTTSFEVAQGSVDVHMAQLGISAVLHVIEPSAPIAPFAETGMLATVVFIDATAPSPALTGRSDSYVAAVPFLGGGLSAGARGFPLRVRFATGVGLAIPELRFMVQEQAVARYAWPQLFATLSAQYAFFAD